MTSKQFQNKLAKFLYCKGLLSESEFWDRLDELCEDAFDTKNCTWAERLKDIYFFNVSLAHKDMMHKLNDLCELMDKEWAQQLRSAE